MRWPDKRPAEWQVLASELQQTLNGPSRKGPEGPSPEFQIGRPAPCKAQLLGQPAIATREASLTREMSKFSCVWMSSGGISTGLALTARQAVSSRNAALRRHMVLGSSVSGVTHRPGLGTEEPPPLCPQQLRTETGEGASSL